MAALKKDRLSVTLYEYKITLARAWPVIVDHNVLNIPHVGEAACGRDSRAYAAPTTFRHLQPYVRCIDIEAITVVQQSNADSIASRFNVAMLNVPAVSHVNSIDDRGLAAAEVIVDVAFDIQVP